MFGTRSHADSCGMMDRRQRNQRLWRIHAMLHMYRSPKQALPCRLRIDPMGYGQRVAAQCRLVIFQPHRMCNVFSSEGSWWHSRHCQRHHAAKCSGGLSQPSEPSLLTTHYDGHILAHLLILKKLFRQKNQKFLNRDLSQFTFQKQN